MDPEQTFLRVHARLSGMLSQLLTPRIRLTLEYIYLTVAVALFCLLVVMHTNFVQQPGCSSELARIEFTEAQLVQIKIVNGGLWARKADDQNMMDIQKLGTHTESSVTPEVKKDEFTALTAKFWSSWLGSGAIRSKLIIKSWKGDRDITEPQNTAGLNTFLDNLKYLHVLRVQHLKPFIAQWLERRSKTVGPTYLYTLEKGYFLLPEGAKSRHNIRTVNITISAQNSCFGNRWQQILINSLVGYDTILMNSLLGSPGQGYLYNFQTKEFYDLSYGHELSEGPARFGDYFVTKCGVLIMSLFVFFTTTMSVSFTLRETQSRMLKFTVQLQHHARHRLPTFQLIFVHVIESLVFVPIMIGILFFLFEFYDDQLLAFLVLSLVWLCELFTMISVRTPISMQFFPRFFLLYFLVFHIYFFSYAYGFSYLAFSATAAFMQHLILYFWNRFEVPALERFMRARGQLQQAGVQITSSTIYTSTLHIARLNVRNNTGELGPESELRSDGSGVDREAREPSDATGNDTRPDSNPQQREVGSGSSPLNPFGSLLLWILGGATHHGIVSYFSMFRDRRDHGQTNEESTRHENEPLR